MSQFDHESAFGGKQDNERTNDTNEIDEIEEIEEIEEIDATFEPEETGAPHTEQEIVEQSAQENMPDLPKSSVPLSELHKDDDNYGLAEWFNDCVKAHGFKNVTALLTHPLWELNSTTSYRLAKKGAAKAIRTATREKVEKFFSAPSGYVQARLLIDKRPASEVNDDQSSSTETSNVAITAKNEEGASVKKEDTSHLYISSDPELKAEGVDQTETNPVNSSDVANMEPVNNKSAVAQDEGPQGVEITIIQDPHGTPKQVTKKFVVSPDNMNMKVKKVDLTLQLSMESFDE